MQLFAFGELATDDAPGIEQASILRWREWGDEPGSTEIADWIEVTRAECRPDASVHLPFTLIARDASGAVVGVVGLVGVDPEGWDDRGPWVVGTVVDADHRGLGIGKCLMAELATMWPPAERPVWVSTQNAAEFYKRCGFTASNDSLSVFVLR